MRVKKRNGSLVNFDESKIKKNILAACTGCGYMMSDEGLSRISGSVCDRLAKVTTDICTVDQISDTIEAVLAERGYVDVVRAWISYRITRTRLRGERSKPLAGEMGAFINACKYAKTKESGLLETVSETVDRNMSMHLTHYAGKVDERWLQSELTRIYEGVEERKWVPSMRSMQFAGPKILRHNESIYNCAFTLADRLEFFEEEFFLLLCGTGCGSSVQFPHVAKIPRIQRGKGKVVKHFVIPDTIEGWADAIGFMMRCYMVSGDYPEFAYHEIRDEGTPLITTGGVAPGHWGLKEAIENIRPILERARGRQLRPIEVNDIACFNAEAVLSGGIRRSSKITLFSPSDSEMLYAKAHENYDGAMVNKQRAMANNSMHLADSTDWVADIRRCVEVSHGNLGCPGFFANAIRDVGCNPCGEIGLDPIDDDGVTGWGFCNLTEINVESCSGESDFYTACQAAAFLGTLQAGYVGFNRISRRVAERDRLLGVSLTGVLSNPSIGLNPTVLRNGVAWVRRTNERLAAKLGIAPAARLTTIKPSGTSSLWLEQPCNGCHPAHARRYFRRITATAREDAAIKFREVNPHMVETKPNGDWSIVFCEEVGDDVILKEDIHGAEFVSGVVGVLLENWIDPGFVRGRVGNNVSCTIHHRGEDFDAVLEAVIKSKLRAATFVSMDFDDRWSFAPFREVKTEADEARWNEICDAWRHVDWGNVVGRVTDFGGACEGDACVVR